MNIPFIDLKTQYARLKNDIDARIQTVLEHGSYIMGPEVAELETALAEFAGCKHAVTVSSGTDALLAVLMAEGMEPGDAVFMPSFTFTATAEVALVAGAVPVFVDVDPDTFNIDADDLVKRIQEVKKEGRLRPRAIVAVDLYGLPADYDTLQKIADEEGLFLLADAAQGFGGTYKGKRVGAVAPATATSFFPAKPLGCYGDGGAVLTNDDGIVEKVRSIRLHGKGSGKYDIVRVGLNARMDTLQASILLPKLAVFAEEIERREAISRMYDERLVAVATVPARVDWATSAWAQYTLKVAERERVAAELREKGVPTMVYYPRPMHLQPGYQGFGSGEGSLPVSERLSGEVLSLPMHPYLEEAMVDRICTAVTEVMGG